MTRPWTDGPRELLQHAADHLALGGDFDRRVAMISIDNAVELAIKTHLGLPARVRGAKGASRSELETASESFPALLDMLDRYAADTVASVDLGDIEWYHRLRNQLYHSGNGITVDRARVEAYFQIAAALFEDLFGAPPRVDDGSAVHTKTGEFLHLWAIFDQRLRTKLPPKDDVAYYWKRNYIENVSVEAASLWDTLRAFRNNLVHSPDTPAASDVDKSVRDLRRLMDMVGIAGV